MQALVLERAQQLSLRDVPVAERLGPCDVRVAIHTVGICRAPLGQHSQPARHHRCRCARRDAGRESMNYPVRDQRLRHRHRCAQRRGGRSRGLFRACGAW